MTRLIRRHFRQHNPYPPFVAKVQVASRTQRWSYWAVPLTEDYGAACSMGRQFACDMVQYFKDDPSAAGGNFIGQVVKGMTAQPSGTAMHGYEVGFWAALEVLLFRAATREDHWRIIQGVEEQYDAAAKACAAEDSCKEA